MININEFEIRSVKYYKKLYDFIIGKKEFLNKTHKVISIKMTEEEIENDQIVVLGSGFYIHIHFDNKENQQIDYQKIFEYVTQEMILKLISLHSNEKEWEEELPSGNFNGYLNLIKFEI